MQKILVVLLISIHSLAWAAPARAERSFPAQAKRGELKAYQYPSMKIGDKSYRLSAGSRIFNQQNRIIMPASLQIQTAPVMYTLEPTGDLSRIWLLTSDEAARNPVKK